MIWRGLDTVDPVIEHDVAGLSAADGRGLWRLTQGWSARIELHLDMAVGEHKADCIAVDRNQTNVF